MRSFIAKLKQKHASAGSTGMFLTLLKRSKVFDYLVVFYFYRLPLKKLLSDVEPEPEIKTQVVTTTDHLNVVTVVNDKKDIFKARLDAGKFAVVVFVADVPVGYVWGQTNGIHVEERYGYQFQVAPDEVYDFDSFVTPAHRGRGLRRVLANAFAKYAFHELEKSFMTAVIEVQNKHSVRVHESMGYERLNLQVAAKFRGSVFQKVLKEY